MFDLNIVKESVKTLYVTRKGLKDIFSTMHNQGDNHVESPKIAYTIL